MNRIKPNFPVEDFKIAAKEIQVIMPLAFRSGSSFKDDVLEELDTD